MSDHEEENQTKGRIRHYKSEETMLQECNSYVAARKRLPILHSRWVVNRFVNSGYSLHGIETAHNYTLYQLDMANKRIRQLEKQIADMQDTQERLQVELMKLKRTYPALENDERFLRIESMAEGKS